MTECFSLWDLQGMNHTRPSLHYTLLLMTPTWSSIAEEPALHLSSVSSWCLKIIVPQYRGDWNNLDNDCMATRLLKKSKSKVIKLSALLQVSILLSNKQQAQGHSHQCLHCLVEKLNKFFLPLEKEQSCGLFHVPNNGQFSPLSFLW